MSHPSNLLYASMMRSIVVYLMQYCINALKIVDVHGKKTVDIAAGLETLEAFELGL